MNYQEIHDRIVFRARIEQREKLNHDNPNYVYYEAHHILPKCIYPQYKNFKNYPWNKVLLTAREHYVIHQLLVKLYPESFDLICAAKNMTLDPNGKRSKNRLYEWIKLKFNNSIKGKTYEEIYGEEKAKKMKLNRSISHKGKPQRHQKGKTYEEMYGIERANELKLVQSVSKGGKSHEEIYGFEQSKILKENLRDKRKDKSLEEICGGDSDKAELWRERNRKAKLGVYKGKSYEERYGSKEKADEIRKKKSLNSPNKKKVMCVETGIIYDSAKDAAEKLNLSHSSIVRSAKGQSKRLSTGFHWKYI